MKNVLISECSDTCINNFRNYHKKRLSNVVFKQMLQIMKLSTIFILAAIMQVSANSYSQNVTLNETNSNLDKVFTEIRKQTGYDFLYNTRLLRNTVPVTVNVHLLDTD